ncbi:MAG: GntR family transcriptional regulator [Streptosporangiaceae bacterium]
MAPGVTEEMAGALARDRSGLVHASTAHRVTELLRTHIMEGLFPPGTRLSEEVIGQALGVSRNTLREAFRLLCHERLAVHQMNRGIFVPVLTQADVTDIYLLRRLIEGNSARLAGIASMTSRLGVRAAVEAAENAASAGRWFEVRTADLHFHQAVAALAGSPRVDELMRRALAELRLIFHAMADPEQFHAPYLQRNRVIADLIMLGDGDAAERELLSYLAEAESQILDVYGAAPAPAGTVSGGTMSSGALSGLAVPGLLH